MNKKDLRAVLLASALCGVAAVVPVMADEVEQEPVLETSNDVINEDVNDVGAVENSEESINETTASESVSVANENSDSYATETSVDIEVSQKNGWDEGNQQYYENGEVVKNQFKEIDGNTYYFDEYGYKHLGLLWQGDDIYFFDNDGIMQKDYFDGCYYFGSDGHAIKNQWKYREGKGWMYFDDMGSCYRGWIDGNGNQNYSFFDINGDYYLFDADGVMQTNTEFNYYYFGADGKAIKNEWVKFSEGYKYYGEYRDSYRGGSDGEGNEYSAFYEINGKTYAFNLNGYMVTGWIHQWDTWYYFNSDGSRACNQWIDDTYYINEFGTMVTNSWVDDSFYVGSDGKKTKNTWKAVSGGWKCVQGDGTYATSKICLIDGYYYAFDFNGLMVQDNTMWVSQFINGSFTSGYVYADESGHLIKGWYKDDYNQWYYFGDSYLSYNDGLYDIAMNKYYFRNSVMQTSLEFINDGKVYRANQNGFVTMVDTSSKTGWAEYEHSTYYFSNGQIVRNQIISVDGNKYYFDADGKKSNGSFTFEGKNYITDQNGIIVEQANGWYQSTDDSWHYFNNGNVICDEFLTINNDTYYFDTSGTMATGVFSKTYYYDYYSDYKYYIADNNGHVIYDKGWIQNNFNWYYIQDDGSLKNGDWLEENGKYYYFNFMSTLVYGLNDIQDDIYYFDSNGVLVDNLGKFTGWKNFHNVWYYSDGTSQRYTGKVGNYYVDYGVMKTNCMVDDKYYVDYNGEIKKGWINTGNSLYPNWYYADPSTGLLARDEWKFINNQWYYFDENKNMVSGYRTIQGTMNRFDENGVWLGTLNPNTWELIDNKTLGKSWYYINEKGNFMGDCKATINGQTYYFGSYSRGGGSIDTQCLVTNRLWYDRATKEYHWINKDGTGFEDYDGWHRSNQGWYAYFENGKAVQGYKTIDGKSYLFNGGYIYTGVLNYDGKAYVCDSQQNIVSYNEGWNSYEGQWYYIRNGKALMNVMVDGYYLDGFLTTTGKTWLNSAQNVVLLNNGKLAQNEWIEYYGVWYYADNNGHVVKNQWVGDYYLNNEGVMVTNDWIGNYHVGADGKWDATR